MAKKKTVWKSPASVKLNRDPLAVVQDSLVEIIEGRHRCLRDEESLYNELGSTLDRIEKLPEAWLRLEALRLFFLTDIRVLENEESFDEFQGLYDDAAGVFLENAKAPMPENIPSEYLEGIVADLVRSYSGSGGRESLLAQVDAFMDKDAVRVLGSRLLAEASEEERPTWAEGVQAMADAIADPEFYEKAVLAASAIPGNDQILDVANAYLLAERADTALSWIGRIENPDEHTREEVLDLHVACLVQQGKKDEAQALARALYTDFPNAFNLARLCQLVSASESESLLDAYVEGLPAGLDVEYAHLLLSLERRERLAAYLEAQREAPLSADAEDLEALAERLVDMEYEDEAKIIRALIAQ